MSVTIFSSVTSSSVWVNLPVAVSLVIIYRYISIDLDMRRKGATYNKPASAKKLRQKKSLDSSKVHLEKLNWRIKVNSPVVEAAIDQFTRHLVSEWVTDFWYSRLTPDRDGPEELVQIINGVLGEISFRVRDINLIDLLTRFLVLKFVLFVYVIYLLLNSNIYLRRLFINMSSCRDIINVICSSLELYRSCRAKIGTHEPGKLPAGYHDAQLKMVMASEKKLHPALFSAEAEHKVGYLIF